MIRFRKLSSELLAVLSTGGKVRSCCIVQPLVDIDDDNSVDISGCTTAG